MEKHKQMHMFSRADFDLAGGGAQSEVQNYVFDNNPIGGRTPGVQKVCFCYQIANMNQKSSNLDHKFVEKTSK